MDLNSNIEIHKSQNKELVEDIRKDLNSNIEIHKSKFRLLR